MFACGVSQSVNWRAVEAVTTISVPPPERERYPDTMALIRRMFLACPPFRRIVAIDSAPNGLRDWFRERGCAIVELPDGGPPRMNRLLAAARERVCGEFFWTIEEDASVTSEIATRAMALMAKMPPAAAALFLRPVNERGERVYPLDERPQFRRHFLGAIRGFAGCLSLDHAPFNCTVWRTAAFREIDFARTRPLEMCDLDAGGQLRRGGWQLIMGPPDLTALHWPNASFPKGSRKDDRTR